MKKTDLRVIKTQNILYNTLLNLMREKPFEEIKVSDICNQALINRSTFYAHYNDKYELLADYIQELKNSLTQELRKNNNISNTKEYYLEMIKLFLDHIETNKEKYLSIIIHNQNSIAMNIIYDVLEQDIAFNLQKKENLNTNQIPRNIITKFYLGAVVNVGIEWLKNEKKYTKEEMLKYFSLLIPNELNFNL